MKFGIFTMPEHPPRENWTLSYDRDIDEMVTAETLGFDEFWIGEHHTGGFENVPMPELMVAKASAVTSRIKLGTGMVVLPLQDPFHVAERMAFLDHLTHGRLIYGFGGGALPADRALYDIPAGESTQRTNEALDVIWELLTSDEPVTHDGDFWHYKERQIQLGPHQITPPFAVAGLTGKHNYVKCGSRGWTPLSVYFSPLEITNNPSIVDLKAHKAGIEEGALAAGLSVDEAIGRWRISREVYVSDSRKQALEEIREGVERSYSYLHGLGLYQMMKTDKDLPDEKLTTEWLIENIPWIIGSPDDCIRQLHELREEIGNFGTLLINSRDWVTVDKWNRSLELFARYVIPQFQENQHMERRIKLAQAAGKG